MKLKVWRSWAPGLQSPFWLEQSEIFSLQIRWFRPHIPGDIPPELSHATLVPWWAEQRTQSTEGPVCTKPAWNSANTLISKEISLSCSVLVQETGSSFITTTQSLGESPGILWNYCLRDVTPLYLRAWIKEIFRLKTLTWKGKKGLPIPSPILFMSYTLVSQSIEYQ